MTREEFTQILKNKPCSYITEGDKIIITSGVEIDLNDLEIIPPNVEFRNGGHVYLDLLKSIPSGTVFKNNGAVSLNSITSIPPNVEFHNGFVFLPLMIKEKWFDEWKGNIRGIGSEWILRKMVKDGLFEKK